MRCFSVAVVFALLLTSSGFGQDVPTGTNVRLQVLPADPGSDFEFRIDSPYDDADFTIFGLSPARNAFPVATGTTDSSGSASVSLTLEELPGIEGTNLSYYAEVESPQGARSSPWTHVRVPDTIDPPRTSFTIQEQVVPTLEGVSGDWGEIADVNGDGDLDVLLPGVRATTVDETVTHQDRGAFNSIGVVTVLTQPWKVADGSYQTRHIGDGTNSVPATRGYFVFDLSGVEFSAVKGPIVGAQIRIAHANNSYESPDETETVTLYEVTTPADELLSPDETDPNNLIAIFEDLGSGLELGSFEANEEDLDTVEEVDLNGDAVASLNAAAGGDTEWVVGINITSTGSVTGEGELERVFRGSGNLSAATELVLTFAAADETGVTYMRVLENDGNGVFSETTNAAIAEADQRSTNRIYVADVTGDGFPDFVATPLLADAISTTDDASAWLYVNDGDGTFTRDATFPAKSAVGHVPFVAAFADIEGDGDVDIFLGNRFGAAHTRQAPAPQKNELLINDGTGSFTPDETFFDDPVVNQLSLTRVACFGDVNNDGLPDLFIGNSGSNQLLVNQGGGVFDDLSESLPSAEESTWGVEFADIDGDDDYDIILGTTAFSPFAQTVLLNSGGDQGGTLGEFQPGPFPRLAEGQAAIRLGLEVADVNADGLADILFPIHELGGGEAPDLYTNSGGSFVYDGDFESLRGIYSAMPTGDLDGDGDLDAFVPKSGSFGFPDIQFQYYVLFNDTFASDDAPMAWLRGDPDGSGVPDISDALFMLRHIFLGHRGPTCEAAGDVNGSMGMDFSDAIALLVHILLGGYQPAAPYPDFGDGALTSQPDLVLSCDEVDIFE